MTELVFELVEILVELELAKKTRDLSKVPALVEQWQTLVNRLELLLREKKSLRSVVARAKQIREEIKKN